MAKTFVFKNIIYLSLPPFIEKIKIVPPVVHGGELLLTKRAKKLRVSSIENIKDMNSVDSKMW